jgi:hypothetical protein
MDKNNRHKGSRRRPGAERRRRPTSLFGYTWAFWVWSGLQTVPHGRGQRFGSSRIFFVRTQLEMLFLVVYSIKCAGGPPKPGSGPSPIRKLRSDASSGMVMDKIFSARNNRNFFSPTKTQPGLKNTQVYWGGWGWAEAGGEDGAAGEICYSVVVKYEFREVPSCKCVNTLFFMTTRFSYTAVGARTSDPSASIRTVRDSGAHIRNIRLQCMQHQELIIATSKICRKLLRIIHRKWGKNLPHMFFYWNIQNPRRKCNIQIT